MALTPIQLTYHVEKAIRTHLTKLRVEVRGASTFALYSFIEKEFPSEAVTSSFINKIIADMRRAGIIAEVFGKDDIWYLSDAAWALHQKELAKAQGIAALGGTL
jgi:hypothetical protein